MAFGSCFVGAASGGMISALGLTSPPQAVAAELAAMFIRLIAALRSRSITFPHSHRKILSDRSRCSLTLPQRQQVFDEAYHRSASTVRPPRHPTLYFTHRRTEASEASDMALAMWWLWSIPRTLSDSMPTTDARLAIADDALWIASLLMQEIR